MHLKTRSDATATIVMYHYVRDLPATRFPCIKGLLASHFEEQLDYISMHYTVASVYDLLRAIRGEMTLQDNACVLTFDDGLIDHYRTVLPALKRRGLTGAFFPPAGPVMDRRVLDVHKVQFLLAAHPDPQELMNELLLLVGDHRISYSIPSNADLLSKFAIANRFDPGEVIFIKRMLQWVLPEAVRSSITARLFEKYVTTDEQGFSQELYLNFEQLREMADGGMTIGGHGYNHEWLGNLPLDHQRREIDQTVSFLERLLDKKLNDWVMCYPYGSYNEDTLSLLAARNCAMGMTTKVGRAVLSRPLELARLDTNDIPVSASAPAPHFSVHS